MFMQFKVRLNLPKQRIILKEERDPMACITTPNT